jgi:hypothetical protein
MMDTFQSIHTSPVVSSLHFPSISYLSIKDKVDKFNSFLFYCYLFSFASIVTFLPLIIAILSLSFSPSNYDSIFNLIV